MRRADRVCVWGLAVASVVTMLAGSSPASAQTVVNPAPLPVTYQVTMVARECAEYTDIFANRARNDIMESLKDLGPDTPYDPFVAIGPAVEDGELPQSTCTPLPNWTFSFGTGYTRPVPGTNLSYVTGTGTVANRQVTTLDSTPLLDTNGNPTGQAIEGAATFTLTSTELDLAAQDNRFWAMGGTTTNPLNGRGDEFGFGALRCAKDNLNGDNVEWIAYPSGQRHVFCYAFYVQPPPGAGRIVIEKQVVPEMPTSTPFNFAGNLSYNEGGAFTIDVPAGTGNQSASVEFIRGETQPGDEPWTVNELIPNGFELTNLTCESEDDTSEIELVGDNPNSATGFDTAEITLAEFDTVTCRFANDFAPQVGEGRIVKLIRGPTTGIPDGVLPATWDFAYIRPDGTAGRLELPASNDIPSADTGTIESLTAGQWTITEQLPAATPGWEWEFEGGACEISSTVGESAPTPIVDGPDGPTATVAVPADGATVCVFVNRLVPTGGLIVRLTTLGGTGTFGFAIDGAEGDAPIPGVPASRGGNAGISLSQSATTTAVNVPISASGNSTDPLIGRWTITPIQPADTPAGRWVIVGTPTCDFQEPFVNVGPEILLVTLGTAIAPLLTCDYTYRFVPPSTLDLVKVLAGDPAGRTGPVVITATCSDGSSARLEVPVGSASPVRLPFPLSFLDPVTCQVAETATGVAPGASVTTASEVFLNGAPAAADLAALQVGTNDESQAVVVQHTNTYAVPPAPTTTQPAALPPGPATTQPAVIPPAPPPEPGLLPATGRDTGPLAAIAILAAALGIGLVGIARRRASNDSGV